VERLLAWRGPDPPRVDAASVTFGTRNLRARGTSVTAGYTVAWSLVTADDWVTQQLSVHVHGDDGDRSLDLVRTHEPARWTANGVELTGFETALDCDLAYCPCTNTMPVLRHDLVARARAGDTTPVEFVMAWVAVPELTVHVSAQRYTPVGPAGDGGALIRYESGDFAATIAFDADGLVREYPQLGSRIHG
jgi:uncharacterized protein